MEEKNSKKPIVILSVLVAVLVVALVAVSYAAFSATLTGTKENSIKTGYVSLSCTETSFTLENTKVLTDQEGIGLNNNAATCTLTSTMQGTMNVGYDIALYDVDSLSPSDSLGTDNVKIQVAKKVDNGTTSYVAGTSASAGVLVSSLSSEAGTYDDSITGYTVDSSTVTGNHSILYTIKGWAASGGDGAVTNTTGTGVCSDTTYTTKSECESAGEIWGDNKKTSQAGGSFSFKIKVGASQVLGS